MRSANSNTSAQLVRDEDDRFSLLYQGLHDLEQFIGFLRRQDSSRLIQDEDVRFTIEQLDNFHPLLHAHRVDP